MHVHCSSFSIPLIKKGAVMKAVCWMGTSTVETLTVADPTLLNPHDAIIKITKTAICGSDLHLYDGFIPTMEAGDVLGHEFMGIVEEVGRRVKFSSS
jgi:threonine dehydrogenase-like Zn-dependent dehydrogenase